MFLRLRDRSGYPGRQCEFECEFGGNQFEFESVCGRNQCGERQCEFECECGGNQCECGFIVSFECECEFSVYEKFKTVAPKKSHS